MPIIINSLTVTLTETRQNTWTVLSLLQWTTQYFTDHCIDSPRLTAELLLSRVLGYERIQLYTNYDKPLHHQELSEFKGLLKRRLSHEPVQYILGETEFMGLRFIVNRHVLIPRPETEVLVEQVIALSKASPVKIRRVLDIGTGSGNIAVSIAKYLPESAIDAVDISREALAVARENLMLHGVEERVMLIQADILDESKKFSLQPYDLLVSNPPYISGGEFQQLQPEVREFEPSIATTDNGDGLTFYRVIARRSLDLIRPEGSLFVEIAYNQRQDVSEIFRKVGYDQITIIPDYQGIPRIVQARRS